MISFLASLDGVNYYVEAGVYRGEVDNHYRTGLLITL